MGTKELESKNDRERQKKIAIAVLILSVIWILLGPILLTKFPLSLANLTGTGQIGDTIGGITAPIIGLASAILIYLSFTAQIRANEIIQEEARVTNTIAQQGANFTYIIDEFERVKSKFEKLEYHVLMDDYTADGFVAMGMITRDIGNIFSKQDAHWRYDKSLKSIEYVHLTFYLLLDEVISLNLSAYQRKIIKSKVWAYYSENVSESFEAIKSWQIDGKPEKNMPKYYYKAHQLKYRIIDTISKVSDFEEATLS